ncbi:MAG TPA: AraC family transcriptional regulator [Clostridiaceae bacterium]|jgi:AraC-like DNA-binding protein/quercetin dioxygenase-like cupin family protein|nr:AraC family transcriptional regulator [Clostridiaceae bacterium]
MRNESQVKKGYLNEDFRLFHLRDKKDLQFEYHFHDFNKLIIFYSGNVTYHIEGKAYKLKPYDILLVSTSEVHLPVIDSSEVYDRMVIYINPLFLQKHKSDDCDLDECFKIAAREHRNLIRPGTAWFSNISSLVSKLEEAVNSREFGSRILSNAYFIALLVHINRLLLARDVINTAEDVTYDEITQKAIKYINDNLTGDLSIDNIANRLFISKSYLMHKFKESTGFTVYSYILKKRLIRAKGLIDQGLPAINACMECGFNDYASFIRAFKREFGLPPKTYYKDSKLFKKEYEEKKHYK